MTLLQAILLAVVQGLTEFLPISSTAHLVLFPWLLGWPEPGLAFDVALHAGTLLAVVLFFLRTWVELVLNGFGIHWPRSASAESVRLNRRLFWYIVAATMPAALVGWKFEHVIEDKLRKPLPIALALILVALLMAFVEWRARMRKNLDQVNLTDAMTVGAAQATALFPGVSRSGITIVAGLWQEMTRETAARFSFLLSTPIIAGAALKELPKLARMHQAGTLAIPMSTLLISIAVSGVVGYAAIAFFLRYLQTRTLQVFIYYRLLFGLAILLLAFLRVGAAR